MAFPMPAPRIGVLLLLLSTLLLSSLFSNPLVINFTVICMYAEGSNDTTPSPMFSTEEKSILFSTYAIGNLIAVPIVQREIARSGLRSVLLACSVLSSLSTALFPVVLTKFGFWPAVVFRVLQSIGVGPVYPAISAIPLAWSTPRQFAVFTSVITWFAQLGPVFTMSLSGEMCSSASLGWQTAFYSHAALTAVLTLLFFWLYTDDPSEHTYISEKELVAIKSNQTGSSVERLRVPWKKMLTDSIVLTIILAHVCNYLGQMIAITYAPTILNKVFHLPITKTGLTAAAPYLAAIFLKIASAVVDTVWTGVSDTFRMRFFQTIALVGSAVPYILVANIDEAHSDLGAWLFNIGTALLPVSSAGYFKTAPLHCRQFSSSLMSVLSFLNCLIMLVMPFAIGAAAPDDSQRQWAGVLYATAGSMLLAAVVFCVLADGIRAEWTVSSDAKAVVSRKASRVSRIVPSDALSIVPVKQQS